MPTARLFIYEDAKQTSILCLDLKWSSESRYYHTFRRNCCVTTTNIMTGCDLFCYERRFVRLMRQSTSQPFFIDPVYKGPDKCLHGQKQARKKKGSKLAHLGRSKIRPVPPVSISCERKVKPCKFFFVQKFVRKHRTLGVAVVTIFSSKTMAGHCVVSLCLFHKRSLQQNVTEMTKSCVIEQLEPRG